MRRTLVAVGGATAIMAATVVAGGGVASAAVPSNNNPAHATVITSLPFSATEDTTQATTNSTDKNLNASCGAPATEASVWFKYTSPIDDTLVIDVSQSDYSAGLIIANGSPASLSFLDCGPGELVESVAAGDTIYMMAFDDTPGSGNGGSLQISVDTAPPPPEVSVTVDPRGHFNSRTAEATVTGTVTCTGADLVDVEVGLRQNVGRVSITGSGFAEVPCDGTENWSATVTGDNGRFGGGKAIASTSAFACGVIDCSEADTTATVSLRK